jgi:thiosulfate dehydrogenase [quinone] large subunit
MALLAALLSFNMAMLSGPDQEAFHLTMFVIHLTMAWLGAGRCFGVDYFFYKRRRGIWW